MLKYSCYFLISSSPFVYKLIRSVRNENEAIRLIKDKERQDEINLNKKEDYFYLCNATVKDYNDDIVEKLYNRVKKEKSKHKV